MSSPRRHQAQQRDIEPFPNLPTAHSSSDQNYESFTTSTTTTTVVGGDGDPVIHTTTTPAHRTGQTPSIVYSTDDPNLAPQPYTRTAVSIPTQPTQSHQVRRRPIGIRRLSSNQNNRAIAASQQGNLSHSNSGRRRSASAPQDPQYLPAISTDRLTRQSTRQSALPALQEESAQHLQPPTPGHDGPAAASTGLGRKRSISNAARSFVSRFSNEDETSQMGYDYEDEVVDFLDAVDPEVQTLTTLTNVQNSLFVPDLGRWLNRRPTYTLSQAPSRIAEVDSAGPSLATSHEPQPLHHGQQADLESQQLSREPTIQRTWSWQRQPRVERSHSITSVMTDSHYAVLPHGVSLADWTQEDKEALDDHVRHMLHSRRSKFKQRMRAFGKYIQKPLGFFVTLYATLITLFGLAWVLFLIGWIYVGDRQLYIIHIIDSVLVALFAVVGDGLAPFRAVDTYHMCFIANYGLKTWRLRREKELPALQDQNDLPERQLEKENEPAAGASADAEFSVLTPEEQKKLVHHQSKFAKSHSFYKPHETSTHYAFPLKLLITIVVLLDCHSLLQISLGAFTWGWSYHTRPSWITAVILSISITVNITAGILISVGDRKTRKKDVLTRMTRQDLTSQAIQKVKKHKAERESMDQGPVGENFEAIQEEDSQVTDPRMSESRSRAHA